MNDTQVPVPATAGVRFSNPIGMDRPGISPALSASFDQGGLHAVA
jgi:hypothetical protein